MGLTYTENSSNNPNNAERRNWNESEDTADDTQALVMDMDRPEAHTTPLGVHEEYHQLYKEKIMRMKLKFFFMNPIEKWQAKRRFPYKFLVQVFKIILVTIQLCLFAHNRYNHVIYASDSRITFSHLFLKGWDATREVNSYPPALGPLALYNIDSFYQTLDFAVMGRVLLLILNLDVWPLRKVDPPKRVRQL